MMRIVFYFIFLLGVVALVLFIFFLRDAQAPSPSASSTSTPPYVLATSSEARLDYRASSSFDGRVPSTTRVVTTTSQTKLPAFKSFFDDFSYPPGLVTNEFAEANESDPRSIHNPHWLVTSGSLFERDGYGYTGVPDGEMPNALSCGDNCTGSAIFRMVTKRRDFKDVAVSFDFINHNLSSTLKTPEMAWDGVHIFLRYQSFDHLYVLTINRRDGTVNIKKKLPDGGHGEYVVLSSYPLYPVPYGILQKVRASVRTNADRSVTLELYGDGQLLVSAIDAGTLGAPILAAGRVGIRTDNAEVSFDNFLVEGL